VRSRLSIASNPADEVKPEVKPSLENVVQFPTPIRVKNPAAVALGKLGGSKGGLARAAKLSTDMKKAIAKKAADARWARRKDK